MPQFRTPQGAIVTVPDDQASSAEAAGYEPVGIEQAAAVTAERESPDRGVLGSLNAGLTGALSGATLGASDYALKGLLGEGQFERLRAEREGHPISAGIGQIVGSVAPALVAPESLLGRAPAGALSRAVTPLLEGGVASKLAAGAIEGAGQNAGMYLADTALGDRDLSAEGLFGALGAGAAFGTAGGVAALGIEKGTMAARRMFSRAAGTDKAALEAEQAWKAAHQSTIEANDAAADLAKARLAEAKAAREQAQLAKQRASLKVAETEQAAPQIDATYQAATVEREQVRDAAKAQYEAMQPAPVAPQPAAAAPTITPEMREGLYGLGLTDADIAAAPPDQLAEALRIVESANAEMRAPVLSPAAEQRLAQAVTEHDAAKADLDDILRRIESPEIIPGVRPPEYAVPHGEFGAVGERGYDPLKRPAMAEGTPVDERPFAVSDQGVTKLHDASELGLTFNPKNKNYYPKDMEAARAAEAAKFAPHEDLTGAFDRPTGLEGLVNAQREAGQATAGGAASPLRPVELQPLPKAEVDPSAAAAKPIDQMTLDEVKQFQRSLDAKFDKAASGSREYVELSRQWDDAVARRRELETGKATVRVASDAGAAKPLDESEFESFARSWQGTLPAEATAAMQTYTANGAYSHINGPLRLGEGLEGIRSQALRDAVPALDSAIAGAPAPREMTVFRGVTGTRSTKEWNDVAVGDSIVDRGYGSTSSMPHVGTSYATGLGVRPGVELRITVPKGYPAAPVPSEIFGAERELLLPRNTKYTVTKVVAHDNGRVVFVTVGPAAEGEASSVAVIGRREAKGINELSLSELEDRGKRLDAVRMRLERSKEGRASEELKSARSDLELIYQRRKDIKAGKVPEPAPTLPDAGPPDDLLSALQGTESKLGAGEQLGRISNESPAAAEYVSKKLAKREADAAYFRARAKGETAEADAFFASLTRPKTRDAYVAQNIGRAMREEGSHAAALAKVEREWAEMSGHPLSVAKLEERLDEALERAHTATTPAEVAAAEQEIQATQEQLTRVGKRPSAVDDVAVVAKAVTDYERSAAKLVEELGPEAPPAAQEAAKAFRAAEDHADRKVMDRTTRAIDDGVDSQGRPRTVEYTGRKESEARMAAGQAANAERQAAANAPARPSWDEMEAKYGKYAGQPALPPTSQEALAAAKAERSGADVAYKRARVGETEAKMAYGNAADRAAASRAAMETATPQAAAPAAQSALGSIATTIGIAGELGVPGIPKPHDIPVIGPLLGMYLKYKALKAASGRFVGRVAANGDTRAAALVARTKDKVAKAVDRTLGLVAEAAPKARGPIVATAAALGHRIFDDGEPDAKRDATPRELAAVRIREIANASTRPDLVQQYVRKELRGVVDPDLLAAAEAHLTARFQYLANVMPKAPPPNPYSKREWLPSAAAANDLAQRLEVVHDPTAAFANPTPAKVDTLRNVSPKLLEFAQRRLIDRIGDAKNPVPYKERIRASSLYGVPLDDSLDPQSVQIVQAQYALSRPTPTPQPAAPPTSSVAADTNLTQMYQTGADRRAMR